MLARTSSPTPRTSTLISARAGAANCISDSASSTAKKRGQDLICKVGMTPRKEEPGDSNESRVQARGFRARPRTRSKSVGAVQQVFRLTGNVARGVEAPLHQRERAIVAGGEHGGTACAITRVQDEGRRQLARPLGGQVAGRKALEDRGLAVGQHVEQQAEEGLAILRQR